VERLEAAREQLDELAVAIAPGPPIGLGPQLRDAPPPTAPKVGATPPALRAVSEASTPQRRSTSAMVRRVSYTICGSILSCTALLASIARRKYFEASSSCRDFMDA
jgi:hypothetical protein